MRGINSNAGSSLPATYDVISTSRGRGGGRGHAWLTGLLPWWGWLVLAITLIASFGVSVVVGFFQEIVSQGGRLLGLGAVALVVGGVAWAVLGFFGRMIPHRETHERGHHMVRHGLIGAAFGFALMLGALNVAWGVGSVAFHDATTAISSRVKLPSAPPSIQIQIPNGTNS